MAPHTKSVATVGLLMTVALLFVSVAAEARQLLGKTSACSYIRGIAAATSNFKACANKWHITFPWIDGALPACML